MQVVPYQAWHLRKMNLQNAQIHVGAIIDDEYVRMLEQEGVHSFSMLDGDTVLICAGIIPIWQGRAQAWAMLAKEVKGQKFVAVHKAVVRFFETCYINRIEATVDEGFEQGHRWLRMLGFHKEADCMRGYRPGGGNSALYAKVRA